tara:strand:+ start:696 stop:908 length:213 start_codon:yes stop_codon:yes gene_type:complete
MLLKVYRMLELASTKFEAIFRPFLGQFQPGRATNFDPGELVFQGKNLELNKKPAKSGGLVWLVGCYDYNH